MHPLPEYQPRLDDIHSVSVKYCSGLTDCCLPTNIHATTMCFLSTNPESQHAYKIICVLQKHFAAIDFLQIFYWMCRWIMLEIGTNLAKLRILQQLQQLYSVSCRVHSLFLYNTFNLSFTAAYFSLWVRLGYQSTTCIDLIYRRRRSTTRILD